MSTDNVSLDLPEPRELVRVTLELPRWMLKGEAEADLARLGHLVLLVARAADGESERGAGG